MRVRLLWLWMLLLSTSFLIAQEREQKYEYYISSVGWHTAIVIPASSLPDSLWPVKYNFSEAHYLEIGWGEADYFPDEGFNFLYAIKAIFWPTPSVLHINPINGPVEEYYNDTNVVRLEVSGEQFQELINFLVRNFKLSTNGKIVHAAKGLNFNSHFFKGKEKYYFPKNSNVWVARALKSSGYSLKPLWYQTTGHLLCKAESFGEKVGSKQ